MQQTLRAAVCGRSDSDLFDQTLLSTFRRFTSILAAGVSAVQLDQAKQELTSIAQTKISEFPRPPQASLGDGFLVNALQADLTRSVRPALLAIIGPASAGRT